VITDPSDERAEFRSESVGVVAPIPAFGFYINHALRRDLILEIRTSFIDLEIGEHSGRIFTTWGSLTWYFARHWGVGVGLTGSDVVYDKDSAKDRLKVELRQSSLTVNVTAGLLRCLDKRTQDGIRAQPMIDCDRLWRNSSRYLDGRHEELVASVLVAARGVV
jgi:hypothetical protein